MKSAIAAAALALMTPLSAHADSGRTPSPAAAKVFIIEPKDGAEVSSPISVTFGIEGMDIAPAGSDKPNSGHHHLLVDTAVTDFTEAVPKDEQHIHFGKGQTQATVELKPGKHTLQLLLADKNHIPHDPPVKSDVITITVK